jgi:hypothetical protein
MRRLILIVALLVTMPVGEPVFAVEPPPPAAEDEALRTTLATLQIEVGSLRKDLGAVRQSLVAQTQSETAPPWGAAGFAEIDRRIERLAQYQERIAAGIETPAPRLDEPMVLFTVALCMGILGFLGGRIVGRRSSHNRRMRL